MKKKIEFYKGLPAAPGIAIGKAYLFSNELESIPKYNILPHHQEQHIARLKHAISAAIKDIRTLQNSITRSLSKLEVDILTAQILLLKDPTLTNDVIEVIVKDKYNVEWAFSNIIKTIIDKFKDNEYMQDRISDINDISKRVLNHLLSQNLFNLMDITEPVIMVAAELTPSETISIPKKLVKAFITDMGGKTSHTAIIARALEIPAVVGLRNITQAVKTGDTIIVDGYNGKVFLEPEESILKTYKKILKTHIRFEKSLQKLKDLPASTTDGKKIILGANIELSSELKNALKYGANKIGLYRSEFMYLSNDSLPSLDLQFNEYKKLAMTMSPLAVTIRTLDIGGDKLPKNDITLRKETNPFLGNRSIRLCLEHKDIFITQLRAILMASHYGTINILLPMVSFLSEIIESKKIFNDVKKELKKENISFKDNIKFGIMIETPAAVLMAEHFAKEVDFFSIGSNDLIQYTLAVDRTNQNISHLYQPFHPAVLKQINYTIKTAHEANIKVSICGEIAANLLAIPVLVGMQVDELSMAPYIIPEVKKMIVGLSMRDTEELVRKVLGMSSNLEVKTVLLDFMKTRFKDIYETYYA